jgi:type 2A phosphatase activator TIP41
MNPESTIGEFQIKIEPEKEINLEHFTFKNWDFFWSEERMMSSKELDMISDKMKVTRLPDMFFGYNRFYIVNSAYDFVYEINPCEMIDYTSYTERKSRYMETGSIKAGEYNPITMTPNFVYYFPTDAKVQYYEKWKNLKINDVQKLDSTADWTFSSSYMGTTRRLSDTLLIKYFNNFDCFKKYDPIDVKPTDEQLPVNRLGQDNQILKYMETNLYDDELCDNGLSEGKFRFRIMDDCFFGLLRSYLRVDNVIVRIIDTRIFHSFGDKHIFRDFQVKENTFDNINKKGFKFSSEWSLSQGQSDIVSRYMDPVFATRDLIYFER